MPTIINPPRARFNWRHTAYCILHFSGFLASTLLMSWGLFVLFFLMLGDFSFDGLMHHLNNFTSRYVAADPARSTSFIALLTGVHLFFLAVIVFFRRHNIAPTKAAHRSALHD